MKSEGESEDVAVKVLREEKKRKDLRITNSSKAAPYVFQCPRIHLPMSSSFISKSNLSISFLVHTIPEFLDFCGVISYKTYT